MSKKTKAVEPPREDTLPLKPPKSALVQAQEFFWRLKAQDTITDEERAQLRAMVGALPAPLRALAFAKAGK